MNSFATRLNISTARLLGASALALALALLIPAGHASAATRCGNEYTVKSGDVLWRLAAEHHTNVWTLAQMNHIPNPNLIYVGQCMAFPGQAPATTTTTVKTVKSAVPSSSPSRSSVVSVPAGSSSLRGILTRAADDHGVSPALVMAIARQESGWSQSARGRSGEIGLMQILPATGASLNAGHGTRYDIWTAQGNAELGAMFLSDLVRSEHGCLTCAISAYNEGPGNFAAHGYLNWHSYVAPVLAYMRQY